MTKYEPKFQYWHKIVGAHPRKKKELLKDMPKSKLSDLIMTLRYPHNGKPHQRVIFTNFKTGKDSWIDVVYLGRVRTGATMKEVKRTLKLAP